MTISLTVSSIACDGCAEAVTKAIQNQDPQAQVSVDVPTKLVSIITTAPETEIRQAIIGGVIRLPSMNTCQHLLIFTRYPEVGKTKTRLIPLLGPKVQLSPGSFNKKNPGHSPGFFEQLQANNQSHLLQITVCFKGGSLELMQQWLGSGIRYRPQGKGDLGQKMEYAIKNAFADGANQVVVIGTDCPSLTVNHLTNAFDSLGTNDLVIGPAEDGGYYLLGMNRPHAELFVNIDWGTQQVLAQTQAAIASHRYQVHYLTTLPDLDRPEDWLEWQKASQFSENKEYREVLENIG